MARILFFGKLGDLAGGRERVLDLPEQVQNVTDLIAHLSMDEPALGEELGEISVRVAINEEISHAHADITNGDEIAFLPPVSGG